MMISAPGGGLFPTAIVPTWLEQAAARSQGDAGPQACGHVPSDLSRRGRYLVCPVLQLSFGNRVFFKQSIELSSIDA
jgi:hypothetical protein